MKFLNKYHWYRKWRGGRWHLLKTYPKQCDEPEGYCCPGHCYKFYWVKGEDWKKNSGLFKDQFIHGSTQKEDYYKTTIVNPTMDMINSAEMDPACLIETNSEGIIIIHR